MLLFRRPGPGMTLVGERGPFKPILINLITVSVDSPPTAWYSQIEFASCTSRTVKPIRPTMRFVGMTTLAASKTRIPPDALNRVAYGGERIRVERRGAPAVAIISLQDLELLEYLEDRLDIEAAEKAIADMKAKGEQPVDWQDVKARLGL